MKRDTGKQHQSWKVKCTRLSFAKALQEGSKKKD